MPDHGLDAPERGGHAARFLSPLLAVVGGVLALRLIYLFWMCPYNLVEDEASYWEWSRHLDWSYYSKGPGIAWAIRAATELLGTSEAAIRTLPAISSALATLAVGALAGVAAAPPSRPGTRSPTFAASPALYAATLFILSPIFLITSIFATIDGPYVACWGAAAFFGFLALERASRWAWPALGLALGIGFLFKYTILLLIPGLLLYGLARRRRLVLAPGWPLLLLVALVLFGAGLVPVLYWNNDRGWPTLAHLLGHVGARGGDMPESHERYNPMWTLEFLGAQIGGVGPALVIALFATIATLRGRDPADPKPRPPGPPEPDPRQPARLFLIACAAPILLFYLAVSLFAEPEGNWAMGGYVTLLALAGWTVAEAMPHYHARVAAWRELPSPRPHRGLLFPRPQTPARALWNLCLIFGGVVALGMLRADLLAGAIAPGSPEDMWAKTRGAISRRVASLTAPSILGQHAGATADQLRQETGLEPFFIAQHYGRTAILAFYIPGRPAVRSSSSRMHGRRTQYDFWPDRSLDDPALLGRPAVLSGATLEQWRLVFDRVEPIGPTGKFNGEHKRDRLAFLGFGYRGWPGNESN